MNTLLARLRRARTEERGFTLVELIVTIAILGVIAGGISAMLISSLRSQATSRKILDTTNAQQQIAFWLPADMQSFGAGVGDISTAPTAGNTYCGGFAVPGTRVLHLSWTDNAGATTKNFSADYAVSTVDGVQALSRYLCAEGVAATQVLVRGLSVGGTVPNGVQATYSGGTVTMRVELQALDGSRSIFQVSSVQRLASATGGPGGGGSIPTVPVSDPCIITGSGVTITPASVVRTAGGTLSVPVVITIQTDGACGLLAATAAGWPVGSVLLTQVVPSANPLFEQWTATLDTTTGGWNSGSYTVSFTDTGAPITNNAPATGTLVVTGGGCSVSSFTLNPYSVNTSGAGKLSSAVTMTAAGVDNGCGTLTALITAIAAGGLPPENNIALNPLASPTRTGTLNGNLAGWVNGLYKIEVLNNGTPTGSSANLDVQYNSCRIDTITVTPATVAQVVGAGNPKALANAVSIQAAQTGPATTCTGLVATIAGLGPGVASLTFSGAAPWSATLAANAQLWEAGTYTVTFSATTPIAGVTTGSFQVTGSAAKVEFTTHPASAAAGASLGPITVEVRDTNGILAPSTANVSLAIGNNPNSGALAGVVTRPAVNGVATFPGLSVNNVGVGYTLVASSVGLTSSTSNAFNITAGPAAKLTFLQNPSSSVAGVVIAPSVTVRVEDGNGNLTTSGASITLAIGTNPGGGTLGGTTTIAASNGIATFADLSINKSGNGYTLTAGSGALTAATSTSFNITAGSPSKLVFGQQPANTSAGVTFTAPVSVRIEDALGNLTTSGASVDMLIGTNPGVSTLGGTATIAPSNGVATFANLTLNRPGTGYTLSATSTGFTSATSSAFNVIVGPVASLSFTTQPAVSVMSGSSLGSVGLTAFDAAGNRVPGVSVTVSLSVPAGATLTGTVTQATNASGVATFVAPIPLSVNKVGTYTLKATAGGVMATSNSFTVTAGPVASLSFTTQPNGSVVSGASLGSVAVTALDAAGNSVPGVSVTVSLSVPAGATLAGTTSQSTNGSGVATFLLPANLSVNKVGTYTLKATAGTVMATSNSFTVTAGPVASLSFTTQPAVSVVSGSSLGSVGVTAFDAAGNPVPGVSVTVSLLSVPAGATLTGTVTQTTNASGVATFPGLSVNKVGSYSLTANAGTFTATSATFTVTTGPVASLSFTTQPTPSVGAGASLGSVALLAVDVGGNPVSGSSVTVALTTPAGATLSGTLAQTTNASGVATFAGLSVDKVGTYTLRASRGAVNATSANFSITPGTAAGITFSGGSVCPVSVGNKGTFNRSIVLVDSFGNVTTNQSGSIMAFNITLSPTSGSGTLSTTPSTSPVSVSISLSASTSGVFNYTRPNGPNPDVTVSATRTISPAWTTSCVVKQ